MLGYFHGLGFECVNTGFLLTKGVSSLNRVSYESWNGNLSAYFLPENSAPSKT